MNRFRFRFWNKLTNDWIEAHKGLDGLSMFGESMIIQGSVPGVSIEDLDNIVVEGDVVMVEKELYVVVWSIDDICIGTGWGIVDKLDYLCSDERSPNYCLDSNCDLLGNIHENSEL